MYDEGDQSNATHFDSAKFIRENPQSYIKKHIQFFEAHYDERNVNSLCCKLTSLTQLPDERIYLFVMTCTELREVLLASLKSDVKLRYFNFEPSLKLRWCRARDLFGSQIPVTTGGFELRANLLHTKSLPNPLGHQA